MIEFRTYLTGLVAVFLALGLGMLIGSALIGSPSSERQQRDLRVLQQNFAGFSEKFATLRAEADDVKGRLHREDQAMRETMPSFVGRRLAGQRIAVIMCGELDDTAFLSDVISTLESAGASVSSTTRIGDDWLPFEEEARLKVVTLLGLSAPDAPDAAVTSSVGVAIALGRESPLEQIAKVASGIRLDGDYSRPVNGVLLISGTQTNMRYDTAKVGLTPETGLLKGLRETDVRIVAAEPDGAETVTTVPLWSRLAPATVDNIDMASGQLSLVFALAGRDGRFGIKRAAERAIPELR